MTDRPRGDSDEDRLRVLLDGQEHCDCFLTPIADPRGKSVLVVGAGAGTETLWCLRRGAREVVGIDIAAQSPAALQRAIAELGLEEVPPFSLRRLPVEEAHRLGRRFELILSNNVFEHLSDLRRALEVCAQLVEPGTGRIAIFTSPLYHASAGSHLPVEPWEHLWEEPAALRERTLPRLPPRHPLHALELRDYLDREISLNHMRLPDLLQAIRDNDLVLLNLRVLRDRRLRDLPSVLPRLEALRREGRVSVTDLTLEGVGLELMRLGETPLAEPPVSTEELRLMWERLGHEDEKARLREQAAEARREARLWEERASETREVLDSVEASWSFRLGRALTAPGRWLRGNGR